MPLGIFIPGGQRSGTAAISITGDDLDEGDETVALSALFDLGTAVLEDRTTLTITDDDTAGGDGERGRRAGGGRGCGTASYTVVLDSRPAADVTVTPSSDDAGAAAVSPASRTFHAARAGTSPLTFTVSGVADTDTDDERVEHQPRRQPAPIAKYAAVRLSGGGPGGGDGHHAAGSAAGPAQPGPHGILGHRRRRHCQRERDQSRSPCPGCSADADNDSLTVTATSGDEAVATVSVASDYSSLTVTAKSRGTATITVTADDGNGGTVEDSFTVTVKAAPVVASAISDLSMEAEATQDISLSGVFRDADGDALTITADTSDFEVAEAILFQGTLTVIAVADGSATVTVTAEDSDGNVVSDQFYVSVTGPPTPAANLRCIAKTGQVAFLWDAPEWSGGETYAYDYELTLPDGRTEAGRLIGLTLLRRPGEYQAGTEASISVTVVYQLADESEVYSAAETLTCTVKE